MWATPTLMLYIFNIYMNKWIYVHEYMIICTWIHDHKAYKKMNPSLMFIYWTFIHDTCAKYNLQILSLILYAKPLIVQISTFFYIFVRILFICLYVYTLWGSLFLIFVYKLCRTGTPYTLLTLIYQLWAELWRDSMKVQLQ